MNLGSKSIPYWIIKNRGGGGTHWGEKVIEND